jgi:hypothetical protein
VRIPAPAERLSQTGGAAGKSDSPRAKTLKTDQLPLGVFNFGQTGIGVLPKVEKYLIKHNEFSPIVAYLIVLIPEYN